MRRIPHRTTGLGAIIGLIALYALLLQVYVGAIHGGAPVGGRGAICAVQDGSAPPVPDQPITHGHPCCPAAHATDMAPPLPSVSVVDWPAPSAVLVAWHATESILTTGPPTDTRSARGPPSA